MRRVLERLRATASAGRLDRTGRRGRRMLAGLAGGIVALVAVLGAVVVDAAPASADESSTTAFVDSGPFSIGFGDDWLITVRVTSKYSAIDPTGTVSLYASGHSGAIARGVPVQAGGYAYIGAPASAEPLAPGEYSLTAIYSPAGGSFLESSKTRDHVQLAVASASVTATATLEDAGTTGAETVHTELSGTWVTKYGPPAGEWAFAVTDPSQTKVYAGSVVQPTGSGATTTLELPLDFTTSDDTDYTVMVAFYPSATSSAGITVGAPIELHFATAAPTVADLVSSAVPAPTWTLWAGGALLVLLLGLLALVIALVARDRRSRYIADGDEPVLRLTSRILLYDRSGSALLFLTKAPDTSGVARWITPGGGVDPGETHDDAVVRELFEETGLSGVELVGPVHSSDFEVEWDDADHDLGHAEFYVGEVDRFAPSDEHWTDDERVDVLAHRWFTPDELLQSGEAFEPLELPELLERFWPGRDRADGLESADDLADEGSEAPDAAASASVDETPAADDVTPGAAPPPSRGRKSRGRSGRMNP